jgi:hypothetical protein
MVPCKKCGGSPICNATIGYDRAVRKQYIRGYQVVCFDCGHESSEQGSEEAAELAWESDNAA